MPRSSHPRGPPFRKPPEKPALNNTGTIEIVTVKDSLNNVLNVSRVVAIGVLSGGITVFRR